MAIGPTVALTLFESSKRKLSHYFTSNALLVSVSQRLAKNIIGRGRKNTSLVRSFDKDTRQNILVIAMLLLHPGIDY